MIEHPWLHSSFALFLGADEFSFQFLAFLFQLLEDCRILKGAPGFSQRI